MRNQGLHFNSKVSVESTTVRSRRIQLDFLTSAADLHGCPADEKLEVAIVGRSNAGKSSFINALAGRSVAKVSASPGKTRLLNFFQGRKYRLVDMPGYGFAVRSGKEQATWKGMIESFLTYRKNLVGLVLVMDIRREWSEDEQRLLQWLSLRDLPVAVVLTKADKLGRGACHRQCQKIRQASGVLNVFQTSALKRIGVADVDRFVFDQWVKGQPSGESQ